MKNMTKRFFAMAMALTMVLGTGFSTPAFAEDETTADQAAKEAITATVTVDAQMSGAYLLAPAELTVNAYEAESYGYTDNVADSVSTLDVLVAETEEIFGSDFTKDTAASYLVVSESGWITTIFGEETSACSFYVNDAMTSTTVDQTAVADGDKVIFFLYQDTAYWTDKYVTFKEGNEVSAQTGTEVTLTVQSADWYGNLAAVEEAQVGYLTIENGAAYITEIGETNEDGQITFTAPAVGSYQIVAYGSDVTDSPIVMNTVKLTVVKNEAAEKAAKEAITATVTADAQSAGTYLYGPASLKVNAYEAESYGYADTLDDSVSTLDVLVAETEKIFGDDFTKDTAASYLAVSESGWITTIFGKETSACSFYVNDVAPYTLVNETAVASGDKVTFFLYQDTTYWSDKYVTFAEGKEVSAKSGNKVTLTVQSTDWYGNVAGVEGASVGYRYVKTSGATVKKIGVTGTDGTITFTAPAAGTYQIVAYGKDANGSPIVRNTLKLTVAENTVAVKTGTTFTINGYKYKVTSNLTKNPTVSVIGYKNKKLKSINVAATVTYKKVVFKVTAIASSAFKYQKYATSATIGKNVKTIGSRAFYGDKKLKKITVKTYNLTSVGTKAFYGIYKKAVIKVPSKKLTAYKKLMKNKGQKSTVKITK